MKIYCISLKRIILLFFCFLIFLFCFTVIASSQKEVLLQITSQPELEKLLKAEEKIAYLTFDDGPTKKMTNKILDILEQEDVPATFFVVGKHVKENPELVKRAYDNGHYIANHGYSHNLKKLYQSKESFENEIKKTDIAIAEALELSSYSSHFFRFPEGYMSPQYHSQKEEALQILKELDYEYVDWNCLNKDSEKKCSLEQLFKNLLQTMKNKNVLVILMHDTGDVNPTDQVLEQSIQYLKEQGYEFRNFYDFYDEN